MWITKNDLLSACLAMFMFLVFLILIFYKALTPVVYNWLVSNGAEASQLTTSLKDKGKKMKHMECQIENFCQQKYLSSSEKITYWSNCF